MKAFNFSLLVIALTIHQIFAQERPALEWAISMGGDNTSQGNSITTDADGNVYTAGWFRGTVDFNPDLSAEEKLTSLDREDAFITKFSNDGKLIWAKALSGTGVQQALAIEVDLAGNVYTSGFFEKDCDFDPGDKQAILSSGDFRSAFISKLDPQGNYVWAKRFGAVPNFIQGNAIMTGIKSDSEGNVYGTGYFYGYVDFDPSTVEKSYQAGNTGGDCFVLKLDKGANLSWVAQVGNSLSAQTGSYGTCNASGLALDAQQNVYITGSYAWTVDFDPSAKSFELTSEGDINNKSNDIFILKLNSNGIFVWARSMGGPDVAFEGAFSIATDPRGNVYTTGWYTGTADFDPGTGISSLKSEGSADIFVSKLTSAGDLVYAKSVGGEGSDRGHSIAVDAKENVYTTGYFINTADFDPGAQDYNLTAAGNNIFVSKLNQKGDFVWAIGMGENGDHGLSISVDKNYSILTTGFFSSTIDFDPGAGQEILSAQGAPNVFIQKLRVEQPNATSITSHPVSDTICQDLTATFNVGTLNRSSTFQWQHRPASSKFFVNLTNSNGFTGVGTSTLQVNSLENKSVAGEYRAIVTSLLGIKDTSNIAILTIFQNPGSAAMVIGDTVCTSEKVALIKFPVTVKDYIYTATFMHPQGFPVSISDTSTGAALSLQFTIQNLGIGTKDVFIKINNNGCETQLKDPVKVIVSSSPRNGIPVTGATICEGSDSAYVSLVEPESGIRYQAFYQGKPLPKTIIGAGVNNSIAIPTKSWVPGNYALQVFASNLGCTTLLAETADVAVVPKPLIKIATNNPVCEDSLIKLQADLIKGYSYEWRVLNSRTVISASNLLSIRATASTATTYELTVISDLKCAAVYTLGASITPKTVLGAISGKNNICSGTTNDYTVTAIPTARYVWSFKKSGLVLKDTTAKVSINSKAYPNSDILTVYAIVKGCRTNTQETDILVSPNPAAPVIKGGCQTGQTATLSIDVIPNQPLTVTWFRNNSPIGNGQSVNASPGAIYKAIVNNSLGCYSDTSYINPFSNKPVIGILKGDSTFCTGDSVILGSNSPTGNRWINSATGALIGSSQSLVVKTSGTLTLSVDNGNCSGSDNIVITVNTYPQSGFVNSNVTANSFCPGKSMVLFNSSTQVSKLIWVKDGIDMKDSIRNSIIVKQPGAYQIKTSNGNCHSFSNTRTITVSPTTVPVLNYKGIQTICQGETLNVSITNFISGQDQWFAGSQPVTDNNGRLQIYPITRGNTFYKVRRTSAEQCVTTSDSVTLIVNTLPVVVLTQSIDSICKGGKVLYSVSESTSNQTINFIWFVNNKQVSSGLSRSLSIDTLTKPSNIRVDALYTNVCLGFTTVAKTVTTYIKQPVAVKVSRLVNPTCFNKDGIIDLTPTGGKYKIIGGNLKSFRNSNLSDTVYAVTMRDTLSSCVSIASFPLVASGKFDYQKVIGQPECNSNTGSVKMNSLSTLLISGDTINSISTSNLGPKKYRFSIASGTCSKKDSVILVAKAPFKLRASIVQPSCTTSGTINLSILPQAAFTVTGALRSASNSNLGVGRYNVRVTDPTTTCFKDTSFTLINPNAITVRLQKQKDTLCQGPKASLRPAFLNMPDTSLYSFSWVKKGVEVATRSTPLFTDSGKYVVTVKNQAGCSSKDSLLFYLAKTPVAYAGDYFHSCSSSAVIKVKNKILSGESSVWTNLSGNSMSVVGDSIINISALKQYPIINKIVREVKLKKCSATDTLKVYFAPTIISYNDSSLTRLAGDTIKLKVYENDSIAKGDKAIRFFNLKFVSNIVGILDTIINGPDVQFITNKKLKSDVYLEYQIENSCNNRGNLSKIHLVALNKQPVFPAQVVKANENRIYNFKVKVKELDANNYLKSVSVNQPLSGARVSARIGFDPFLGDTAVFFTADYSNVPDFKGIETIQLRLDDGENLPFDLSFIINVVSDSKKSDGKITIYNAVSPNGDGKNDFLEIENLPDNGKVTVQIFNRWGDEVYSESNYDNVTRKFTGDNLPDGTYYYVIDLNNGTELEEGYVILKK